jgi:hypothetical protein
MCLALLCVKFLKFDLLGEYIYIENGGKSICSHQVYDFFFESPSDWSNASFRCISANSLINKSDSSLMVKSSSTIGAQKTGDDEVYQRPLGLGANFDEKKGEVTIEIGGGELGITPLAFTGKVLNPEIKLIDATKKDQNVLEIMKRTGTVFDIHLGDLKKGLRYACRLIVTPVSFLSETPRNTNADFDDFKIDWEQDAKIISPAHCRFVHYRLLQNIREQSDTFASAAALIQNEVSSEKFLLPRQEIHRIITIIPKGCTIPKQSEVGCICWRGERLLTGGRLASEWGGGVVSYWNDDIELVTKRIYYHLHQWSKDSPKKKEEITVNLQPTSFENCILIVDELVKREVVEIADSLKGTYKIRDKSSSEVDKIILDISQDRQVIETFKWIGYEVDFCIRYQAISPDDKIRIAREKSRPRRAFKFSIFSLCFAIVSIILGIISILLRILLAK